MAGHYLYQSQLNLVMHWPCKPEQPSTAACSCRHLFRKFKPFEMPTFHSKSSMQVQHGFRNTLLLTDIRNRASVPFREVSCFATPAQCMISKVKLHVKLLMLAQVVLWPHPVQYKSLPCR